MSTSVQFLLPVLSPHAHTVDHVLTKLQTSQETGLRDEVVKTRVEQFGKNVLPQSRKKSALMVFLNQFKSTIVAILLIATVISYIYEHYLDVYIILFIIIVNAIVGFIQEFQAERSIEALKDLLIPRTKVKRDGKLHVVSSWEVVPGDIVVCSEGDNIPADARILTSTNLQVNESSLTGESLPIEKMSDAMAADTPMAEQKNMIWMGTLVVAGECEAVVVATGKHTILGQIAKDISGVKEEDDHFKQKTNQLGKQMGMVALFSTILIFIVGFFVRGFEFEEIFMFSTASLVSALPEGLPVILTIVLALSAKRMASRNAIVRRLSATETLAVVNTIITDKTGTLTQNKMTITAIRFPYQPAIEIAQDDEKVIFTQGKTTPTPKHFPLQKLLDIADSCHSVKREYDSHGVESLSGDPTEVAIVSLADKAISSPSYYQQKIQKQIDLPFHQLHRWRACLVEYQQESEQELFVIGSPETVLDQCSQVLLPDHKRHSLEQSRREHIQAQIEELTVQGMRVLALTYKPVKNQHTVIHEDIHQLTFVGLVGIIDPPHPGTKAALATAKAAHIDVIMATGDHPLTAKTIGLELGLIDSDSTQEQVLTESEVVKLSDQELYEKLQHVRIFARMTPASKLRLAKLLQAQGKVVAMTGDGVNDAPALKQADIGIGMGKKGTDVAREASDIVLADDNFSTVIVAIEQGRTQLRNVRRTSLFYITTNIAESMTLVVFLLLGLPMPLLPKQILWLNLVTAGITDIALATEPVHNDVLTVPPSRKNEGIIQNKNIPFLALITVTISILAFIFFNLYQPQGVAKARTMLFIVLSMTQIFNMFNMRSLKSSLFSIGFFTSKNVNWAFMISVVMMLAVLFVPGLVQVFEFEAVGVIDILFATTASLLIVVVSEMYKKAHQG